VTSKKSFVISTPVFAVGADQHVLKDGPLQRVDGFKRLVQRDARDAVGDADE